MRCVHLITFSRNWQKSLLVIAIVTASIKVFHRFLKIFHSLTRSCFHSIFCNNRPKPIFPRASQVPKELAVLQPQHSQYWIGLSGKQLLTFVAYGTDIVILKTCFLNGTAATSFPHPSRKLISYHTNFCNFIYIHTHIYTCKWFSSYELTCMKCLQSPLKNWKHQHADKTTTKKQQKTQPTTNHQNQNGKLL